MADSFTLNLNLRKPEVGHADDTWGGTSGLNADLDQLDAIFTPNGTGTAVGLHIGAMTLPGGGTTPATLKVDGTGILDTLVDQTTFRDATDPTKQLKFSAAGISTGQTRTLAAPDASGTVALQTYAKSFMPTGTILHGYWGSAPPAGFIFADGRTIGDASSGATNRANVDTLALFTQLWNFADNTRFPVLPSRGGSASADWAAHKTITLPDHSGRVTAGRDDLSGTNRNNLSTSIPLSTTRGATGGAQQQSITVNTSGSITGGSASGTVAGTTASENQGFVAAAASGSGAAQFAHQHNFSVSASLALSGSVSASGSTTVNTVQPTIMCDVVIAL